MNTESPDYSTHWLKVDEVAIRLQVPRSWVYTHAASLGGYKLGKYWRFAWNTVVRAIQTNQSVGSQPNDSAESQRFQQLASPKEQNANRCPKSVRALYLENGKGKEES